MKNSKKRERNSLQKYKDLASQLPIWQFVGNFLAFSDHSFGAGFKIQGVDISCMDAEEINLVVDRLEKLLISLENGTKIQILYKLTPKVREKIERHREIAANAPEDIKGVAEYRADFLEDLADKGHFFKPEIFLFVRSGRAKVKKLKISDITETTAQDTVFFSEWIRWC